MSRKFPDKKETKTFSPDIPYSILVCACGSEHENFLMYKLFWTQTWGCWQEAAKKDENLKF